RDWSSDVCSSDLTEAMRDGSDAIADWPLLNAMVNVASGASWVSIHHGGGVGIGRSIHAGQVTVADGTAPAGEKIRRVLTNDPGMVVIRHVDAGDVHAVEVSRRTGGRETTRVARLRRRFTIVGRSCCRWAGTPAPAVTGASPGPARTPSAAPGSASRPRRAASPWRPTATATSGPGWAIRARGTPW